MNRCGEKQGGKGNLGAEDGRRLAAFSPKQLRLLTWWKSSAGRRFDGVICDGAVRSGKTLCMSLSFVLWSMARFQGRDFALCGKTISALRRNLLAPLMPLLEEMGFECREKVSRNLVEIRAGRRRNRYYLFSGKDEGSASLIQGMTLAGVLFDETALLAHSFVEQAVARCSVEGSKYWFNCNPEHPRHWFYTQWISKRKEKRLFYLHFTMKDNPALSPQIRKRYEGLYSGSFYRRFVRGEWASAAGAVYPMFSVEKHVVEDCPACDRYWVSCDYGTVNPCSMGLWGEKDGVWYRVAEYYHDSKQSGEFRTDEEYYAELERLIGGRRIEAIVVDPSAASLIACIRKHGRYPVLSGKNGVLEGIGLVSGFLAQGKIKFAACCRDCLREFELYRWEENSRKDQPVKENDHAMDDLRYFVSTVCAGEPGGGFFAIAKEREICFP